MDYPNWFQMTAMHYFAISTFPDKARMLQIGAFTGDASVWLMENTNGHLTDVDTWQGSAEEAHEDFDWSDVEKTYDEKTRPYKGRIDKRKMTSDEFFAFNPDTFDFIYIDGNHEARAVLRDAFNAFDCLNHGGVIAFDDYTWHSGKGAFYDPEMGIKSFYGIYEQFITVQQVGAQLWIRKN